MACCSSSGYGVRSLPSQVMVGALCEDSYAYACGFESGLGHGAYGTLGKSPHPVVLCPVSPMSEDACAWC